MTSPNSWPFNEALLHPRLVRVWRYSPDEPDRPWMVSDQTDDWENPPAFQTWAEAQRYADDYAHGRSPRLCGYQPYSDECPECGDMAVIHTAGPLPVCRSCDWTGWPDTEPVPS